MVRFGSRLCKNSADRNSSAIICPRPRSVFGLAQSVAAAQTAITQSLTGLQVPIPKTPANVPGPVPGDTMTSAYVQLVGHGGSGRAHFLHEVALSGSSPL
jgi:hypothetical protein